MIHKFPLLTKTLRAISVQLQTEILNKLPFTVLAKQSAECHRKYFQRDSKVFKEVQKGKSGARYREIMGRLAYLSCIPRRKILQNIMKVSP